jgi:carboxylesterase type B
VIFYRVRKYISKFGGDANSITAMGHSAGAINIGSLLSAETGDAKPLFDRAILLSGTMTTLQRMSPTVYNILYSQILTNSGCVNANQTAAFECLRSLPADSLLAAGMGSSLQTGLRFGPVISANSILPRKPSESYNSGNYWKIPLLIGSTENEVQNSCIWLCRLSKLTVFLVFVQGGVFTMDIQTKEEFYGLLNFFVDPTLIKMVNNTYFPMLATKTPNEVAALAFG